MSARSEALASRFDQANQEVIGRLSTCPAEHLAEICPAEGWTAAALGAHVAVSYTGIVDNLIKPVVAGQPIAPFDPSAFTEGNAKAAAENAALPQEQVVQLLREEGAAAVAYLRGLSDAELDRTTTLPIRGDKPVSAEQLVEMVLIGHTNGHGESLRQGLG